MLGDSLLIVKELTPIRGGAQSQPWTALPRPDLKTPRLFGEPYTLSRPDERMGLRFIEKSWRISRSPLWTYERNTGASSPRSMRPSPAFWTVVSLSSAPKWQLLNRNSPLTAVPANVSP